MPLALFVIPETPKALFGIVASAAPATIPDTAHAPFRDDEKSRRNRSGTAWLMRKG
jgi:hypothetical protein